MPVKLLQILPSNTTTTTDWHFVVSLLCNLLAPVTQLPRSLKAWVSATSHVRNYQFPYPVLEYGTYTLVDRLPFLSKRAYHHVRLEATSRVG